MVSAEERNMARQRTREMLDRAGIVLTPEEKENIEVTDLGLGRLYEIGLELVVYVNTKRVCAKELVLFPWQICPEHRHPAVFDEPGKEETFRCRWGEVYLYIPGEAVENHRARVPEDFRQHCTVWNEIVLHPGEQYTLAEGTLHWFQGGPEGAIISEFSTTSRDEYDIFTDPEIKRVAEIP
jgi:D-lyxose ketol-isomerase